MRGHDDEFSHRTSSNMVSNLIRTVIMALVGLLMVPYYIDEFGIATYAILPLATSVTSYFTIVADSLSNAFSRYLVVAIQSGDREGADRVFTTSVLGMARLMLILVVPVVAISVLSPYVFNTHGASAVDVQLMFLMIMVASLIISFSSCLGSVFMAHNRMYVTYWSRTLQCVSQVVLVVLFFVTMGASLPMIGVSYLVSAVLMLAVMFAFIGRASEGLRLSRRMYDGDLLREMGGLGFWAVASEIGNLLFIQASLVIVNLMLGSAVQGTFSVAANVISMVHTACTAVAAASVPLAYRCYAEGDVAGLRHTVSIFSKFIGVCMAFPIAYLMVFSPQIMSLWLGGTYEGLDGMLRTMLLIEVSVCSVSALMNIPVAYNRMRPAAAATLLTGVFNVAASVLLLLFTDVGVLGVCAVWVVSMAIVKLVFYPLYCRGLTGGTLRGYYVPIAVSNVVFAALLAIGWAVSSVWTMPTAWVPVLAIFFAGFLVFFVLVLRFLFTREERETVATYLPGFVRRFMHL